MADRYVDGHVQRLVSELRAGDRVDLENDPFADPDGFADGATEFGFEFEIVETIERETAECIRVDFESGFSCGFADDHWLDVDGEQVR